MRQRVVIVDLSDPLWFSKAHVLATTISLTPFEPSAAALEMFDQVSSMRKCLQLAGMKTGLPR
jgi:hypothetical protein